MKYVLVINVPEPMESKDVKIDYLCYYHCGNIIKHEIDAFLKPLPRRMPMRDETEFYLGYMNGKTKYLGFNEGYNACLEDITGETE